MGIEFKGLDAIRRFLNGDVKKAIQVGALGIAAETQDRTAPYPPAPPRIPGRGYYVRGTGGFSASGKQTSKSQTMNRRWDIRGVPLGARLRNFATYSAKVKGRKQTKRFTQIGWTKTYDDALAVINDGTAAAIMIDAFKATLKKGK